VEAGKTYQQYALLCKGSNGGRRRGGEKERRGNGGKGRREPLGLLVLRQQELGCWVIGG
jgi:hypothetical protein